MKKQQQHLCKNT